MGIVVSAHKSHKVHVYLGGVGVYSSLKDYLTLLQHLLQVKGKILCLNNPLLSLLIHSQGKQQPTLSYQLTQLTCCSNLFLPVQG